MAEFRNAHYSFCLCCNAENEVLSADFNSAQSKVEAAEGGYSNDARDAGNWTGGKVGVGDLIGTKYGISAPVLVKELRSKGYTMPITASTMKNLEYKSAIAIYKKNYWAPIKGDQIKDQKVADMIYDSAVNQGVGAAQNFVKDSLNTKTYDIDAINSANPTKLFNDIGKSREAWYIKKGGYALNSWLSRLKALGYEGVEAAKRNIGRIVVIGLGITGIVGAFWAYKKYSQ